LMGAESVSLWRHEFCSHKTDGKEDHGRWLGHRLNALRAVVGIVKGFVPSGAQQET